MDSAEDIAEALVTHLNASGDTTSIVFSAEVPEDTIEIERDKATASVYVYPYEETEESRDRADMVEAVRTVQIVVQAPLTATVKRKGCLKWLNEIKALFAELTLNVTGGGEWIWRNNISVSLYDFDAMKTKKQFLSTFNAEFAFYG